MVVGVAVAAVLLATGAFDRAAPARPRPLTTPPDGAAAFVAAWRAHRLASWSVDEVDARSFPSGATIRFEIHEAQRPPDSIRLAGGTASGRRGSTEIGCATPEGSSHPICRLSPAAHTWAEDVDTEVAALTRIVEGPGAIYRVTALGGGCYQFETRVPAAQLSVLFGRSARYCLDARTGAVVSSRVVVVGAVDTITTTDVHAPATDADLALPKDATFEK